MSELIIDRSQAQGNLTILNLKGDLDGSTEDKLIEQARLIRDEGVTHLLVDLSEVTMLTSAGLRAIQKILRMFTPHEDKEVIRQHGDEPYKSPYFKMICPNPEVYYILNISGFLQNMLIYNDRDEAVRSFAG